jgi:hypothetical protein
MLLGTENTYAPAQMHNVQNPDAMKFVPTTVLLRAYFNCKTPANPGTGHTTKSKKSKAIEKICNAFQS